jgi:hypothetical protein
MLAAHPHHATFRLRATREGFPSALPMGTSWAQSGAAQTRWTRWRRAMACCSARGALKRRARVRHAPRRPAVLQAGHVQCQEGMRGLFAAAWGCMQRLCTFAARAEDLSDSACPVCAACAALADENPQLLVDAVLRYFYYIELGVSADKHVAPFNERWAAAALAMVPPDPPRCTHAHSQPHHSSLGGFQSGAVPWLVGLIGAQQLRQLACGWVGQWACRDGVQGGCCKQVASCFRKGSGSHAKSHAQGGDG